MRYGRGDVGGRELRQNLSVYRRHATAGASLDVRERGRRVAVLAPAGEGGTVLDRLIAAGRATPARGNLLDLGPPRGRRPSRKASGALSRLRDERRP